MVFDWNIKERNFLFNVFLTWNLHSRLLISKFPLSLVHTAYDKEHHSQPSAQDCDHHQEFKTVDQALQREK